MRARVKVMVRIRVPRSILEPLCPAMQGLRFSFGL